MREWIEIGLVIALMFAVAFVGSNLIGWYFVTGGQ